MIDPEPIYLLVFAINTADFFVSYFLKIKGHFLDYFSSLTFSNKVPFYSSESVTSLSFHKYLSNN